MEEPLTCTEEQCVKKPVVIPRWKNIRMNVIEQAEEEMEVEFKNNIQDGAGHNVGFLVNDFQNSFLCSFLGDDSYSFCWKRDLLHVWIDSVILSSEESQFLHSFVDLRGKDFVKQAISLYDKIEGLKNSEMGAAMKKRLVQYEEWEFEY